jgi:nucleoside-diphosphate-sugar epimerase
MKIFLTGFTGFVGSNIGRLLAEKGYEVYALCRNEITVGIPATIHVIIGDLNNVSTYEKTIANCDAVIHAAAFVKLYHYDEMEFYNVNYIYTRNLLKCCERTAIKKFVFVSSAGTRMPVANNTVEEYDERNTGWTDPYVLSKLMAEKEVISAGDKFSVTIVNPSRMYGPGPLGHSNSITTMINSFRKGEWHFKPPFGFVRGSYNHIDETAEGIINAMLLGRNRERYMLAGENISYDTLFDTLRFVSGSRHKLFQIPYPFIYTIASVNEIAAAVFKRYEPKITLLIAKRFKEDYSFNSNKAVRELNYRICPFQEGVRRTIKWLELNNK